MPDSRLERSEIPGLQRCRRAGLFSLAGLVRIISRMSVLRRRTGVWNAMRVFVALLGVALVVVPSDVSSSWWCAVLGLVLFLAAVLATPTEQQDPVDAKARELGAVAVVNGGRFHTTAGEPVPARLIVAPARVLALDPQEKPLVEIPFREVSAVCADRANGGWKLRVEWDHSVAEFCYEGLFAEHLARVAERTLRDQLRRERPALK